MNDFWYTVMNILLGLVLIALLCVAGLGIVFLFNVLTGNVKLF